MKNVRYALFVVLMALVANAGALTYPVERLLDREGKLYGANKVLIDNSYFDVRFVDGTCAAVFSGCDSDSDFPSRPDAFRASQALLDQVLVGLFDTGPALSRGCEFALLCIIATPEGISSVSDGILYGAARNGDDNRVFDLALLEGNAARSLLDLGREPAYVWAVWSPSTFGTVPEPASLLLVLTAMMTLLPAFRGRS